MRKELFFNTLSNLANKINIKLTEEQCQKFFDYMNLLLEWNEKINLTAITDQNEVILKHFIDSIVINKYIKENDCILDIGTGAGFPGIPLKIINTNNNFTLADSLNKRIIFLEEVVKSLELSNIECIHGRAEELAKQELYREKYNIVASRAVARLNIVLEYMLPFIQVGGKCICMKGPGAKEEVEEAKKAIEILGGKLESIDTMLLPETDMERNIIIIKKIKKTPSKYPRKAGMPTKQPIV